MDTNRHEEAEPQRRLLSDSEMMANRPLIDLLKRELGREQDTVERARKRVFELRLELADFGIEIPLSE